MRAGGKAPSLVSRVIWRVLPPAILLLFAIWYAASQTTSHTVELQVRERLNLVAQQSAAALAAKLGVLQEAAHGLAANDLIINGIIDAQERENYLSVLFQSLRVPGPDGAVITLTDYRGRAIISTGEAAHPDPALWLDPVMNGLDHFRITSDGALIATPVLYAGAPEGAIIVSYDGARVPELLRAGGNADATLVLDDSGGVLSSTAEDPAATGGDLSAFENGDWLLARATVAGFPNLTVISALDSRSAGAAVEGVRNIMLVTVLCSIGALGGGIVLAAYLATRPLSAFIGSIGAITHATDLRRRITSDGSAEFQDLAISFNEMIERLERTTTSRDNFDNIVNSMREMLIVTDGDGVVTFANRAARKTFGLDLHGPLDARIADLFTEKEQDQGRLAPRNVDQTSPSIEATCNLGGQPVHVLVTASRTEEIEAGAHSVIYIALDVTESKKANDALLHAKQQLQTAIESISEAFALYDASDRLVLCNSKYREVYSDSADTIVIGARFEEIVRAGAARGQYPAAAGRIEDFVRERVALHKNPSGPFEQALPDGRWLRIEERFTNDGGIVGIRTDITELKTREAELRRQAEALERTNARLQREIELRSATEISLRDSEMRARAVFETAADGVVTIDSNGRVGSLNPAAEQIFGHSPGALVGVAFAQCVAESCRADHEAHFARRRSGAEPGDGGSRREMMGLRRSGDVFPMELTMSAVPLGERTELTVIVRGISERKKIEKMKNEFISTVSHELRTPLTSINGSIGILRSGAAGELPAPAQKLMKIAFENCRRLIDLINDILDIEKFESDGMQFEMTPLSVTRLIDDAVEVNGGLAAAASVALLAAPPAPDAVVSGDYSRLSQVLTNLISNAVKHSPKGAEVRVAAERRGDQIRISVIDHGSGVPQDFRDRIFGRFSQADGSDTRQSGGTGLGLAICKSIVEHHGGVVGYASEPDERTEFHFTLKLADAPL